MAWETEAYVWCRCCPYVGLRRRALVCAGGAVYTAHCGVVLQWVGHNTAHCGDVTLQGAPRESEFLSPDEATGGANKDRITTKFMTKYERARVLGTRALQLRYVSLGHARVVTAVAWLGSDGGCSGWLRSMNAPPMVDVGTMTDPLQIAMAELRAHKVPLIIRRYLPDGSYEDWPVKELSIDLGKH